MTQLLPIPHCRNTSLWSQWFEMSPGKELLKSPTPAPGDEKWRDSNQHHEWLLLCHVRADREGPGCLWSWYLGNFIHLHSSVSTAWAGQRGDSSTSAAWAALGSEREAQLSADVFMRKNTLGKKKKKEKNFKNANLFCCIQYVLVSCLKGPSGLKTCSTCVSFYVFMLEVLNIPCCKNKSWIIKGFFFICLLVDIPLTLVHPHLLDSSMKGFSHKDGPAGQRTENRKIKKWTCFSDLSNNFLYNCPSWAPPALFWCRKTILSIFLKKVAKSQSKERN